MPRIMINGVIWSKAEDRILKVGVMRYGNNQWDRVLKLLPGKTSKQCEDRMKNGLEPNIKKFNWTKKEDKKLLHLAVIMPGDWQNISSIVKRTAAECFLRHERLMYREEKKIENLRNARIFDPSMQQISGKNISSGGNWTSENGLDFMLSNARERLVRIQKKKAKFMARERRLAVARRFASIKRRRERNRALRTMEMFNINNSNYNFPEDDIETICQYSSSLHEKRFNEIIKNIQKLKEATNVIVVKNPNIAFEELHEIIKFRSNYESTSDQISYLSGRRSFTNFITEEIKAQKNNNNLYDTFPDDNNNKIV